MTDIENIIEKIKTNQKLTESELKLCAFGEVGNYIVDNNIEEHRWHMIVQTIFEIDGQLYAIDWMRGLTELQENEYWYQPYKVIRKEQTVIQIVYEPVK